MDYATSFLAGGVQACFLFRQMKIHQLLRRWKCPDYLVYSQGAYGCSNKWIHFITQIQIRRKYKTKNIALDRPLPESTEKWLGALIKEETVGLSLDEPLTDSGRQRALSSQEEKGNYSKAHGQYNPLDEEHWVNYVVKNDCILFLELSQSMLFSSISIHRFSGVVSSVNRYTAKYILSAKKYGEFYHHSILSQLVLFVSSYV